MHRTIALYSLLICYVSISTAAPAINNLTGTLANGATVSLIGADFGAQGPTVRIFDDFEGGTTGQDVDLNAVVGTWFGYGTFIPKLDDISLSGNHSMRVHAGGSDAATAQRIIKAQFPATTEFYLSYWLQIPVGFTFPGADIPGKIPTRGVYPDTSIGLSTWKLVWIFDGDSATQDNDIALPTHVGGDLFLAGNNTREYLNRRIRLVNPTNFEQADSIFRFGEWVRITVWMKAGPDLLGPGDSRYTLEIPTSGINQTRISTSPVFTSDAGTGDRPPYQWTHMNFTGFTGNGHPDWSLTRPLFDDIYLATGAGSQARVEICDKPAYADCSRFGLITVGDTDWTDTNITGVIRKGGLSDAEVERAFAYVYDKDGRVNATGFPLCPKCPLPPVNLQAE